MNTAMRVEREAFHGKRTVCANAKNQEGISQYLDLDNRIIPVGMDETGTEIRSSEGSAMLWRLGDAQIKEQEAEIITSDLWKETSMVAAEVFFLRRERKGK